MCIDPNTEFSRTSQRLVLLQGGKQASPLIQRQGGATISAEQTKAVDEQLEAFGPPPTNTTGSLILDALWMWAPNLFWHRIYPAMPVRLRMWFTRPMFRRDRRKAKQVPYIDHGKAHAEAVARIQRLIGGNE
jgi:hypothetical protein